MNPKFVQSALNITYLQVVKEISNFLYSIGNELVCGGYNSSLCLKCHSFDILYHLLQLWTWGLSVTLDNSKSRVFENNPCKQIALVGSSFVTREFEPIACLTSINSNQRLARFILD